MQEVRLIGHRLPRWSFVQRDESVAVWRFQSSRYTEPPASPSAERLSSIEDSQWRHPSHEVIRRYGSKGMGLTAQE